MAGTAEDKELGDYTRRLGGDDPSDGLLVGVLFGLLILIKFTGFWNCGLPVRFLDELPEHIQELGFFPGTHGLVGPRNRELLYNSLY